MVWFKIDDGFWSHPKVLELSDAALALWTRAGSYCAGHRTCGFVPHAAVRVLGASRCAIAELVSQGMWKQVDGGFQFHEWRKHQDGDYRPNIPRSVRMAVLERDGYRCVFCGAGVALTLDHIIRYRNDGPDTVENLRVLCAPCNIERG